MKIAALDATVTLSELIAPAIFLMFFTSLGTYWTTKPTLKDKLQLMCIDGREMYYLDGSIALKLDNNGKPIPCKDNSAE